MTTIQIASVMIVCSGAIHAAVNAILKSGGDKMSSRALIDGFAALMVLPFAFVLPLPHGAWGWLAGSGAVHLVYLICLVRAFEVSDMSVAYPIARGVAPAVASMIAVAVFRETLTWPVAAGIGLVCGGVLTTTLGRHASLKGAAWAAATGACVAVYTVLDAQGVRAAPGTLSYIVWDNLILAVVVSMPFALWRGRIFSETARRQWKQGLIAGAASVVSYGLALGAYRLGDTPRLAALRETSILFAVAIAVFFLKEEMTLRRLAGVLAIAAGAGVLLAA